MEKTLQGRVRFGTFELDLRAGELHQNGHSSILQDQQLTVLVMLLDREGEIATREEIKKSLWPNDTVVEFDHGINNTIKNLRRILGDSADEPKYIGTIPRRGYRLLVPVEWGHSSDDNSGASPVSSRAQQAEVSASDDTDSIPRAKLTVGRLTGKIVSHYRVLEVIGGGGMGLVYRAEDLKLGRAVALKFLPEDLGDDPKARERFEREAKAVSALNHPNICYIHEFDEHDGHPFIVMELLQGKTLRDHLAVDRFRLTTPEGLEVAIQIASGLEAAHEKGIIHRDIKPANIFITEKNVAKILDFGVAKMVGVPGPVEAPGFSPVNADASPSSVILSGASVPRSETDAESKDPSSANNVAGIEVLRLRSAETGLTPLSATSEKNAAAAAPAKLESTLTRTGMKLGTAGYMSPEQIRGEPLDARTDIFSFGLVLYEMATGVRAFTGETEAILHDAIQHREPKPMRELAPELSPQLANVIAKCVQKDPPQRYQAVHDIADELREVEESSLPRFDKTARQTSRLRRPLAIALLLVVVVLGLGVLYKRFRPTPKLTDRDTIVLADVENKTGDPVLDGSLSRALNIALRQTPFLNILSSDKIKRVLRTRGHSERDPVTSQRALEICAATNSTAIIDSSIADAGNQYEIELRIVQCGSGTVLAISRAETRQRNLIIAQLGRAALNLRRAAGEHENTLAEFNEPLESASSASLESLKLFDQGYTLAKQKDISGAIQYYIRATEIDPKFALAFVHLARSYGILRETALSRQNFEKANGMPERLTKQDRLLSQGLASYLVTGDLESAAKNLEQLNPSYSDEVAVRSTRCGVYRELHRLQEAAAEGRQAILLDPDDYSGYYCVATSQAFLQQYETARNTLNEALARGVDHQLLHWLLYVLAFRQHDELTMRAQVDWEAGSEHGTGDLHQLQMQTDFYFGRRREAYRSLEQALYISRRSSTQQLWLTWKSYAPLYEAEIGNSQGVRESVAELMQKKPDPTAKVNLALALARSGEPTMARDIAKQVAAELPGNAVLINNDLPVLKGAILLQQGKTQEALAVLPATAYRNEGVIIEDSCRIYLRGMALRSAGREQESALEFRTIIDHPEKTGNIMWGALAHLQLARAYAMMGDADAARKSYQDFLTLWKDADPDIPIYKQAKAEYAKLNTLPAAGRQMVAKQAAIPVH